MSHSTAAHAHAGAHSHGEPDRKSLLRADNITMPSRSKLGFGVAGVGAVLAIIALIAAFSGAMGATPRQGLASVHVGAMAMLGICLTATLFIMVFHLLNAGWTSTLRRQFENVSVLTPIVYAIVLIVVAIDVAKQGQLFAFMDPVYQSDFLLIKKWSYFFLPAAHPSTNHAATAHAEPHFVLPMFWLIRAFFYLVFWTWLTRRLYRLSIEQDKTGDAMLSAQARKTSAWGVPVLALTIAFAGFDFLMALDFRYFSTMWGVYYFAGSAFGMFATVALIAAMLRSKNKLVGVVTAEHNHDLGKMLFAFTVFWAYIAFSQYFLTWYSNISEETGFFTFRTYGSWKALGIFLMFGHFIVPFLFLISRHVKKHPVLLPIGAAWAVLAHIADIFWIVRPMPFTHANAATGNGSPLVDAFAIGGVVLVFVGLLIRQVTKGPLVAVNEPYLNEGLAHKNYV
jgi:hypothetical protein